MNTLYPESHYVLKVPLHILVIRPAGLVFSTAFGVDQGPRLTLYWVVVIFPRIPWIKSEQFRPRPSGCMSRSLETQLGVWDILNGNPMEILCFFTSLVCSVHLNLLPSHPLDFFWAGHARLAMDREIREQLMDKASSNSKGVWFQCISIVLFHFNIGTTIQIYVFVWDVFKPASYVWLCARGMYQPTGFRGVYSYDTCTTHWFHHHWWCQGMYEEFQRWGEIDWLKITFDQIWLPINTENSTREVPGTSWSTCKAAKWRSFTQRTSSIYHKTIRNPPVTLW